MQGGVQMRNIGLTMQECMRELQAIGIELGYVIDIRWRRMDAFGICETKNFISYRIGIHEMFKKESVSMNEFKSAMCHELLHTCKDCIEHNQKWVNLARKADDIYGYSIAEYKEPFDIKHPEAPILHKLACNCGGSWKIREAGRWEEILADEPMRCPWCGKLYDVAF